MFLESFFSFISSCLNIFAALSRKLLIPLFKGCGNMIQLSRDFYCFLKGMRSQFIRLLEGSGLVCKFDSGHTINSFGGNLELVKVNRLIVCDLLATFACYFVKFVPSHPL